MNRRDHARSDLGQLKDGNHISKCPAKSQGETPPHFVVYIL